MSLRLSILKHQQIWKLKKQLLKALQKVLASLNPLNLINLQNTLNENVNNFRKLFYEKVPPTENKTRLNPSKTNRKFTEKITGEWGLIKNLQTDSIGRNFLYADKIFPW